MNTTLTDNVFWVGYIDWAVRDFHGYKTGRGSTYNAYLVVDEKTALIDAVKAPYAAALLEQIQQALLDDLQLRCNYFAAHSNKVRELVLNPLALIQRGNITYLAAITLGRPSGVTPVKPRKEAPVLGWIR